MRTILSNRRVFEAATKDSLELMSFDDCVPRVVLITARTVSESAIDCWADIVKVLVLKGMRCLLCVGAYSENLHDAVDDFLVQLGDCVDRDVMSIVTTFHADGACDDVVDYFVYATDVGGDGCLLAIVDDSRIEDLSLLSAIRRA